jgi:hypothetical protein
VDESTMVISFAPDAPVKQVVTEISRPAGMIWDTVTGEKFIDGQLRYVNRFHSLYIDTLTHLLTLKSTDPDSSRVQDMISREYEMIDLTLGIDYFTNAALYIRQRETV